MRAIRAIIFVVFFGVGATALSITVLCDDLLEYYHNKVLLSQAEEHLKKLETLGIDYDALLGQVEGDPCALARLASATLGIEPNEPNTVYPRATFDKLSAARKTLSEQGDGSPSYDTSTPQWLNCWCSRPRREILFVSAAALVLISFIFFGPMQMQQRTITVTDKGASNTPEDR